MRPLFLLCALFLSTLSPGSAAGADPVRLTNGEWPPYLGEKLPHHGVASRIVSEAFALEGIAVQWEFHPWARSLQLAQSGKRDGSAVWLYSEEREQQFHISDPVVDSGYYLFYRRNYPLDWQAIDDLRGRRVGGTRSYDYGEAFQQAEAEERIEVRRSTSDELNFRQLLAGRIDLFPMDKVVGFDMLHQHFSAAERAQLSFHPKPLSSATLHLLLARNVAGNDELIARFNRGLAQLRDSGKISLYLLEIENPLTQAP
nr:transporter substrate-binding domain-containing protein [uncultured Pseudomonas sp.]